MNKNFRSNRSTSAAAAQQPPPTTTTATRWFCQKLTTNSTTSFASSVAASSRKRRKVQEPCETMTKTNGNCVIANPIITKTQVAKISYTNPHPLTPLEDATTAPILHVAQINFLEKRKEREDAVQEFQNMLNQLKPTNPTTTTSSPRPTPLTITTQETETQQKTVKILPIKLGEINENALAIKDGINDQAEESDSLAHKPLGTCARIVDLDNEWKVQTESPHVSKNTTTPSPQRRRAKTEVNISRPKQSLTARTKSSNQIELARGGGTARTTFSSPNKTKPDSIERKCGYDPTVARQYMKAQQKKRKRNNIKPNQGDAFKKEEIKKRLEELKRQQRMIVTKNLTKKAHAQVTPVKENARSIIKGQMKSPREHLSSPRSLIQPAQSPHKIKLDKGEHPVQVPDSARQSEIAPLSQRILQLESEIRSIAESTKIQKSVRTTEMSIASTPRSPRKAKTNRPETLSHRRVGLLRKPECKEHSFSHIVDFSFEKENVAIEMLTPQIPPPASFERKTTQKCADIANNSKTSSRIASLETPRSIRSALPHIFHEDRENKSTQVKSSSLLTKHPNISSNKKEANIQTEALKDAEPSAELPFWLRPSSVQIYPYNFIQAVRRKLIAMTEINAETEDNEIPAAKNEATSTRDLNKAQNIQHLETKTTPRANANNNTDLKSQPQALEQPAPASSYHNLQYSKNVSDINSNLSSISLQAPISNTVSEVSSLKSESMPLKSRTVTISGTSLNDDKDDTTISSSVFSSPEKKSKREHAANVHHTPNQQPQRQQQIVSPLSLDSIQKLKIETKNLTANKSEITLVSANSNIGSNQNLDFHQILFDFNHGLTQVIEANEQLKSTLDKSQQMLTSPRKSNASSSRIISSNESEAVAYTSDFEEATRSASSSNLSQQFERKFKRMLLTTAKPLLSSPPSNLLSQDLTSNPDMQLDFGSGSQSSLKSTEKLANTLTGGEESSLSVLEKFRNECSIKSSQTLITPQTLEERMATIDQLKENLRRMIRESEENRRKTDSEHSMRTSFKKSQSYSAASEKSNLQKNFAESYNFVSPTDDGTFSKNDHNNLSNSNNYSKQSSKHYNKSNNVPSEKIYENSYRSTKTAAVLLNENSRHFRNQPHQNMDANHDSTPHPSSSSPPPPVYSSSRQFESHSSNKSTVSTTASIRTTCSSEFITLLKVADLDLSRMSSCDVSLSESSSFNYSNVGLYEQLIKSEITKSEHLAALLKMREKAILDRTKGQVAWLQVQKERCKSKGLVVHISDIRKKQRAILIKMSKEREEIKRLLQTALSSTNVGGTCDPKATSRLRGGESASLNAQQQQKQAGSLQPKVLPLTRNNIAAVATIGSKRSYRSRERIRGRAENTVVRHNSVAPTVLRGKHELESSASVEALLRQREEDLRRRREYCERLLEWHRKLDEEELEVFNLEQQLFNHKGLNSDECLQEGNKAQLKCSPTQAAAAVAAATTSTSTLAVLHAKRYKEMERRLKEIDTSLRELNSIAATTNFDSTSLSNGQDEAETPNVDFVRTTGSKLNKLWRRLTSQQLEKFEPNRRYKLCKADLERLYEDAKLAVLTDFSNVEERSLLFEKGADTSIGSARDLINAIHAESTMIEGKISGGSGVDCSGNVDLIEVPSLNLNFSTSPSAEELENEAQITKTDSETFTLSKQSTNTTTTTTPNSTNVTNGVYSPSIAERDFQNESENVTATSSASTTPSTKQTEEHVKSNSTELIKRNLQKFLRITKKSAFNRNEHNLERSLSDTEIDAKSPAQKDFATKRANVTWTSTTLAAMAKTTPKSIEVVSKSIEPTISDDCKLNSGDTLQNVASFDSNSSPSTATSSSIVECISIPVSAASSAPISLSTNSPDLESPQLRPSVIQSIGHVIALDGPTKPDLDKDDSSSLEPQNITNEFDNKSNEIAAKLNEISEAVARLSQSNSLVATITELETVATTKSTNSKQNQNDNPSTLTNINGEYSYKSDFELATTAFKELTQISVPQQGSSHDLTIELDSLDDDTNAADETLLDDVSMPFCMDTTFDMTSTELNLVDIESADEKDDDEPITSNFIIEEPQEIAGNLSAIPKTPSDVITTKPGQTLANYSSAINLIAEGQTPQQQQQQSLQQQLMPDIINELEIRRCQQILLESEQFRQYEQVPAVPYVFVREIPNKPPPPYCPPAHGSPMTTIFPSEERIKDITFRRTHELFCEITKTDHVNEKGEQLPSVLDEKITNIYERIVLDICREYLDEHSEVLNPQCDPTNFHSQLAFFNPPDRLRCIQQSIYKDVRRCLGMDKTTPKRSPVYSIYGQRAKRDHIGQIIIQEMYEEDEKWCSFYHEEDEVLDLIIEEMIGYEISEMAKTVLVQAGGILNDDSETIEEEIKEQSAAESNYAAEGVTNINSPPMNDSNQKLLES